MCWKKSPRRCGNFPGCGGSRGDKVSTSDQASSSRFPSPLAESLRLPGSAKDVGEGYNHIVVFIVSP